MYLNEGGFIKLYPMAGIVDYNDLEGNQLCFNNDFFKQYLPRPYPKVRKFHYLPILPTGINFFTNFPVGLNPSDLSAVFLYLDDLSEVPGSSVTIEALEANFYVTVNVGSAPAYRDVVIVFVQTGAVYAVATPMTTIPVDHNGVVEIKYRTERGRVKNFPYAFDEEDRYNRVQCFASMYGVEYPEELTIYNEVSSGRTQKFNSILQRTVIFETYFLDFATHEGLATLFHHDDVKINDRKYVSTENYNPNYLPEKDLTKGTITLSDSQFSERLLNC